MSDFIIKHSPTVSVILPVFNGGVFLTEAIESILTQTYTDFEFIIIDDCSTDNSVEIISRYAILDNRIHLVKNEHNLGVSKSLNKAISFARGEFIARMDADDIATKNRLDTQMNFLLDNPNIGICGSWLNLLGEKSETTIVYPTRDMEIRCRMLFSNSLAHPSVVFKRNLFIENGLNYDENFSYAQDYELWSRALKITQAYNVPESLLFYRVHKDQITIGNRKKQVIATRIVQEKLLDSLGVKTSEFELSIHERLNISNIKYDIGYLYNATKWLIKLYMSNQRTCVYDNNVFLREIFYQWKNILIKFYNHQI